MEPIISRSFDIVAGILLFIGAILFNYFNNLKDAKNGHINHSKALKWKALSCIPAIFFLALGTYFRWIIAFISSGFIVAAYFYLIFEIAWSVKVYNTPFHKGTATGKNQANTDKALENWPIWAIIALKLFLCIISAWVYNIGLTK